MKTRKKSKNASSTPTPFLRNKCKNWTFARAEEKGGGERGRGGVRRGEGCCMPPGVDEILAFFFSQVPPQAFDFRRACVRAPISLRASPPSVLSLLNPPSFGQKKHFRFFLTGVGRGTRFRRQSSVVSLLHTRFHHARDDLPPAKVPGGCEVKSAQARQA